MDLAKTEVKMEIFSNTLLCPSWILLTMNSLHICTNFIFSAFHSVDYSNFKETSQKSQKFQNLILLPFSALQASQKAILYWCSWLSWIRQNNLYR
jgi:hypothetical protein